MLGCKAVKKFESDTCLWSLVKGIVLPNKVVYASFVINIIQLTSMCFIVPTRLF